MGFWYYNLDLIFIFKYDIIYEEDAEEPKGLNSSLHLDF